MKVTTNLKLSDFDAWSGAIETQERILSEGKEKTLTILWRNFTLMELMRHN